MTDAEIATYIGLPYEHGAYGPDSFNCWGLLSFVERRHFGVIMPLVDLDDANDCTSMFRGKLSSGEWRYAEEPGDGDAALLRGGTAPHVGIYVNGGVLHAMEGIGVIWTPLSKLRNIGFCSVKHYRLK